MQEIRNKTILFRGTVPEILDYTARLTLNPHQYVIPRLQVMQEAIQTPHNYTNRRMQHRYYYHHYHHRHPSVLVQQIVTSVVRYIKPSIT
jgi:hypothetical protein